MKEDANTGSRYTVVRENLGVEEETTMISTSLETLQKHQGRQGHKVLPSATNNIIEAYTGNDVSHKEVRTS